MMEFVSWEYDSDISWKNISAMFQTTNQHQDFEFIFCFFFPWILQICVSFARHRLSAPPITAHITWVKRRGLPPQ